uniref:Speedy protein E4-like n=1 Tax=Suricata suricatta TaxID=37032 RepID=A0A673VHE7_SURSU
MASSEPGSQSEEQSPQSSTSAQSFIVEPGLFLLSPPPPPRVGPHSLPPSHGWKRRREESDEEEEEEEKEEETAPQAEDTWVVDSLYGLKMKLKRRRVSSVLTEHHEVFTRLLEDPVIKKFLAWDKHLRLSDKYLLSMVIAYFSRAGLFSWQYQQIHFFIALLGIKVIGLQHSVFDTVLCKHKQP